MEFSNSDMTLKNFETVCIGMSFEEVINMVGIPQYHTGSGIIWDVYKLNDGSAVMLRFYDDVVVDMKIVPPTEVDSYIIYRSE